MANQNEEDDEEDSALFEHDEDMETRSSQNTAEDSEQNVVTEESNSYSSTINEKDNYLTFGNIFSNKSKIKENLDKAEETSIHERNNTGGGLDAIIAAASVLDGEQHLNS